MDIHPCTCVPARVTKTSVDCYLNTTGMWIFKIMMDIHPCTCEPERVTKTSVDCYLNPTRCSDILSLNWVLHKKLSKQNIQHLPFPFKVAEKLKSNLKSEKTLRQNPSYTHTTLETEELWETPLYTKEELEKEPEAEQVKTQAVRHPKSKATTSSRTNKCVMA